VEVELGAVDHSTPVRPPASMPSIPSTKYTITMLTSASTMPIMRITSTTRQDAVTLVE